MIKKLHRWLALPCGIFFSLLCLTGMIMLWRDSLSSMMGYSEASAEFFSTLTRLHRWLLIVPENPRGGMSVGRFIVGCVTICSSLILISGIVLWWPKTKKMLRLRLEVSVTKGWHRFFYDMHVSLGIYAAIFLLLMALTGPTWSFGWYREAVSTLMGNPSHFTMMSLHFGLWGGLFSKIVYTIAALIGFTLPLTGYYLWWHRCSKAKKNKPKEQAKE